jgi:hypothetical protein
VNNNTDNTSEQLFRILDTPLSTSTNSLGDVQASPHSNLATHAVSQTKFHSNLEDWDNLFSNLKISKLVKDAGNDLGHLETSKIIDFLGSTSKQSVDSQSTTDHRPTKKRRTTTCSPAASSGSDGDDTDDAYKPGRSVPPPPRRRRIPCASSKFESISRYGNKNSASFNLQHYSCLS